MVNPISLIIRAKKLGVLIKDARISSGLSMKDCARAIGVTSSRIKSFENGDKSPSLPELEALAFFLDVPLTHFWGQESRSMNTDESITPSKLNQFVLLRTKIVGALLRQARMDADLTLKELSASVSITPRRLKSYETGEVAIPLPVLEGIASYMDLSIESFHDREGVVGKWANQKKSLQEFLELPQDIQNFVLKPVNLSYLEIAQKLSGLPVDKLRDLAEGILEITL
jgi:transcriptional regulator with XRE-family HTH domain